MITQARAHRLMSNDLINELIERPRPILKTMTRVGPVYTFADSLIVVPRRIVERQIEKGILVAREPSGQTFALASAWGGSGRENAA